MSKTTPVRWWRDDATRYQGRGAYKSPPYDGPMFDYQAAFPPETIKAITEAGLEIRIKLLTLFPLHCGVAYL